jgi:nucleotide-binding universal stress UspA family protein
VTYATLMAHLQLGQSNAGLLRTAGDLAERFHAGVIGIAACQPMQIAYGDGYVYGELIEQDRAQIDKDMKAAKAEFESALQARARRIDWRSTVTFGSLAGYLAHEARSADLVVTSVDRDVSVFDPSRRVDMGELVMEIGRPLLLVPAAAAKLEFDRMIIGWKDTREARRAVADALPFLKQAAHVVVVEIATEGEMPAARAHLQDVVAWLAEHGIAAESIALPTTGDDAGGLDALAQDHRAQVVVAGAYGHSRVREWMLGGVTRDLLLRADRCSLVSH